MECKKQLMIARSSTKYEYKVIANALKEFSRFDCFFFWDEDEHFGIHHSLVW